MNVALSGIHSVLPGSNAYIAELKLQVREGVCVLVLCVRHACVCEVCLHMWVCVLVCVCSSV